MPLPHRLAWAVLVAAIVGMVGAALLQKFNNPRPIAQDAQNPGFRFDGRDSSPFAVTVGGGSDAPPNESLPVMGQVGDFSFTDQHGKTITRKDVLGHVWVADFIFTRCSVSCIMITSIMSKLNKELSDKPEVKLVSFSMDPEFDTPEILAKYAKVQDAESERWLFLTGSKENIYRLTREDFLQAVSEKGGSSAEPIIHSSRFVLLDRQCRMRGFYSGTDPDSIKSLGLAVRKLASQE